MPSTLASFLPARARVALTTARLAASEIVAATRAPWRPVHTARHTPDELRALSRAAGEERAARQRARRSDDASEHRGVWRSVERTTPDSVCLTFARPDGFTFRPGQYVQVEVEIDGRVHRRPYSLCSAPDDDALAIAVRRVDGGVVSTALVDGAAVGDPMTWTGPLGTFGSGVDLAADAPLVCVAGGSGITPILSVLRARVAARPDAPTLLVYANRGYRSVMCRDALVGLSMQAPGLRVVHVLDRRSRRLGGRVGRLTADVLVELLRDDFGADFGADFGDGLRDGAPGHALLCGPDGLMDVAADGLTQAGWPLGAIERERFAPATAAVDDAVGATWSVGVPHLGVLLQVRDDQTILDAARAAGVPLRWSCGMGGCGACRMRVVSGAVAHDTPNCLSAGEMESGATLTCVARPRSPLELAADDPRSP